MKSLMQLYLSDEHEVGYTDDYSSSEFNTYLCNNSTDKSASIENIVSTCLTYNFEGLPNNSNIISWFLCDKSRYRLVEDKYQLIDVDGNDIDGAIISIIEPSNKENYYNISVSIPKIDNIGIFFSKVIGFTEDLFAVNYVGKEIKIDVNIISKVFQLFSELKSKGINLTHYNLVKEYVRQDGNIIISGLDYAYVEGISVVGRLYEGMGYSINYPLYDLHSLIKSEINESENPDNTHQLIYLFSMFCGSYHEAQKILELEYLPYQQIDIDVEDIEEYARIYSSKEIKEFIPFSEIVTGIDKQNLFDREYSEYNRIHYYTGPLRDTEQTIFFNTLPLTSFEDVNNLLSSDEYLDAKYLLYFISQLDMNEYAARKFVSEFIRIYNHNYTKADLHQAFVSQVLIDNMLSSEHIVSSYYLDNINIKRNDKNSYIKLSDIQDEELYNILILQLLCVIYSLYTKCGFVHYDLSEDNIFVKKTEPRWLKYNIGQRQVYLWNNSHEVYIDNFDYSHIYYNEMHYSKSSELGVSDDYGVQINDVNTIFQFKGVKSDGYFSELIDKYIALQDKPIQDGYQARSFDLYKLIHQIVVDTDNDSIITFNKPTDYINQRENPYIHNIKDARNPYTAFLFGVDQADESSINILLKAEYNRIEIEDAYQIFQYFTQHPMEKLSTNIQQYLTDKNFSQDTIDNTMDYILNIQMLSDVFGIVWRIISDPYITDLDIVINEYRKDNILDQILEMTNDEEFTKQANSLIKYSHHLDKLESLLTDKDEIMQYIKSLSEDINVIYKNTLSPEETLQVSELMSEMEQQVEEQDLSEELEQDVEEQEELEELEQDVEEQELEELEQDVEEQDLSEEELEQQDLEQQVEEQIQEIAKESQERTINGLLKLIEEKINDENVYKDFEADYKRLYKENLEDVVKNDAELFNKIYNEIDKLKTVDDEEKPISKFTLLVKIGTTFRSNLKPIPQSVVTIEFIEPPEFTEEEIRDMELFAEDEERKQDDEEIEHQLKIDIRDTLSTAFNEEQVKDIYNYVVKISNTLPEKDKIEFLNEYYENIDIAIKRKVNADEMKRIIENIASKIKGTLYQKGLPKVYTKSRGYSKPQRFRGRQQRYRR